MTLSKFSLKSHFPPPSSFAADLWLIYDYDFRYIEMMRRKVKLKKIYDALGEVRLQGKGRPHTTGATRAPSFYARQSLSPATTHTHTPPHPPCLPPPLPTPTPPPAQRLAQQAVAEAEEEAAGNASEAIAALNSHRRQLFGNDLVHGLVAADTDEALADYSDFVHLLFADDIAAIEADQAREGGADGADGEDGEGEADLARAAAPGAAKTAQRGRGAQRYSYFNRKGVSAFLSQYCVPVADFAKGVYDGQLDEPPVMTDEPEVVATMAANERPFDTGAKLLAAARHCYAIEAAAHPSLRANIRSDVHHYACVNVRPTPLGYQTIEPWDTLARYRYISNKPVDTLKNDDWLWLMKGRSEDLLEVKLHLPEEDLATIKKRMLRVLESDHSDDVALAWRQEHSFMIDLLMDRLQRTLLREVEEQLKNEAEVYVLEQCANYVRNLVSRAPYRPQHAIRQDREPGLRVASVILGDRSQPTSVAMVDGSGSLMDSLQLGYFMVRPHSRNMTDLEHRRADHTKFLNLMLQHRPDVIALGAETMDCRSRWREKGGWGAGG